jgi:hypothetical protein
MGGSDLGWPRHNLKTLFKNNESKKGWGCQVAECLPSKRKALSSNPSATKKAVGRRLVDSWKYRLNCVLATLPLPERTVKRDSWEESSGNPKHDLQNYPV